MQLFKKLPLFLLLIVSVFMLTDTIAQKTIKGVVIDEQIAPVPGASVVIKGTAIGASTDADGKFSITIDSATLAHMDTANIKVVVTFVGYRSIEIKGTDNTIAFIGDSPKPLAELVLLSASESRSERARPPRNKFAVFKVFYGTDRASISDHGELRFSGESSGKVAYGYCKISVPVNRDVGSIPEPSFLKFEFSRDPGKHFVLLNNESLDKASLVTQINERLAKSQGKNAFIFIHGYNVSFYDAALRTAQMAKDLNFDGVPIFYSWPSKNSFLSYPADEETIKYSELYIREFIKDVAARTNAKNIYLIGHSMGTRALTNALVMLLQDPAVKNKIREVILAAPDIPAPIFKRDIVPNVVASKCNLTLYASENDLALKASKLFHSYNRAGQSGESLVVVNGIETIDASNAGAADIFGHSYFADTQSLLRDIKVLILNGHRAAQRAWLQRKLLSDTPYWILGTPVE